MTDIILILTTWPEKLPAEQAARHWLEQKLVACVNILPEMTSIYRWDGEIKVATEHQMIIKTSTQNVPTLQQSILDLHPYECPEILHLAVTGGHHEYLNWITGNTE